ncbi:efflux RND transporter periplasmic adaptor subunit [Candidatus Woesebacteria bacterium]|nr:efflux RND transporter periplasmic adaptor subunit [Candidatus Woesebacteria bacterium]
MSRIISIIKLLPTFLIKRWYIVVILILIVGYFVYRAKNNDAKAEQKTYTVKRETLRQTLSVSGEMNVNERVSLKFQSGGRLAWVGVKEGDYIKKGTAIASLDQRQLEKTLQKYLNTYSKQRQSFEQTVDNNDQLTLSLSQDLRNQAKRLIDQGQFDLNNSVIDVEVQTLAKENAFLISPIDGVLTRVDAPKAGMNVSITDQYEIINPDTMYFSIAVDQTDVVKLAVGQRGKIVLDAFPENEFYGTVAAIGYIPETDETGTTYEVKMSLESYGFIPRVGMTGDVEFVMKELPNAVAVPLEYIEETDDNAYVYKNIDNKFQKVEITTGQEYDGMVEIKKGLYAGDTISEIPSGS